MSVVSLVLVGLLIGVIFGGVGGGGAILTVPALMMIAGQQAGDAITSSLVVVGLAALTGVISGIRGGRVAWRTAVAFGVAGVPAAWVGSLLSHMADPHFLRLGFSCVMLLAAAGMLSKRLCGDAGQPTSGASSERAANRRRGARFIATVVAAGVGVGFLTGFFGVGGGFVIVPALVLIVGLPMDLAVGTSLAIVATNALASLSARAAVAHFDWAIIVPFTLAAMAATVAGRLIADRVPAVRLRQALAALLVLVAGHTMWQSAIALIPRHGAPTSAHHSNDG
jgi:uncharacterized membrane protein YfcA